MKAMLILIAMFLVLYGMKVISFDLPLLKEKYAKFQYWITNAYLKVKSGFDKFIDFFNRITGNENN